MRFSKKLSALALACTLALSGCASTSSSNDALQGIDTDSVNPKLKSNEAHFFSKSGAQGCATGALLGALACIISDSDNKLACAAIAGAAGCAVGLTANYVLDNVRANYSSIEEQQQATIAMVEQNLDYTKELADSSKSVVLEDEKEIATIKANIKKGTASVEDLKAKAKEMDENNKYLKACIKKSQEDLNAYEGAAAELEKDVNSKQSIAKQQELDLKIAKTKQQLNALYELSNEYAMSTNNLNKEINTLTKAG